MIGCKKLLRRPPLPYLSPLSRPPTASLAMYWLGDKPARLRAKNCWLALALALPCVALADHGFTKGDWPFRPLERPATPPAVQSSAANNPIDQFVLVELEKRGLALNAEADKRTL